MPLSMVVGNLNVDIHMPKAPKGDGTHRLPPYDVQQVFVVDEYQTCPTNWMHGSAKASSFFLPVDEGRHLWLDLNRNVGHTHHVAAVVSVQGMNPITGQKTDKLRLEQYREKCPVHNVDFKQDRFCAKCKHNWPPQNYLSSVCTPQGFMWIDGWRTAQGKIRGFLITAETMRGVAAQVIGEERVFAIGIAFYLSKQPKPVVVRPTMLRSGGGSLPGGDLYSKGILDQETKTGGGLGFGGPGANLLYTPDPEPHHFVSPNQQHSLSCNVPVGCDSFAPGTTMDFDGGETLDRCGILHDQAVPASTGKKRIKAKSRGVSGSRRAIEPERLEIGAGANIAQDLDYFDNSSLDFYEDEPIGFIYVNYCTKKDFATILEGGRREEKAEGVLAGLKVGN